MNAKHKPVVILLGGMMVASLALLASDTAWSEAPKRNTSKKTLSKKTKPAPNRTTRQTPPASPSAAHQGTIAQLGVPPAAVVSAPKETVAVTQAVAAKPAPVPVNPYLTVQQPNPWTVEAAKSPIGGNPYLAYLKAQPAPTPWSVPALPTPQFSAPTWTNPFLAFQFPFPSAQAPAAPAAHIPSPAAAPAWVNPYLAYRLPVIPPAPWTQPGTLPPQVAMPAWVNPFQALPQATAPAAPTQVPAPAQPAFNFPNWSNNPYLAYMRPVTAVPVATAEAARPPAVAQAQTPVAPATQPVAARPASTPESPTSLPSLPALPWSAAASSQTRPDQVADGSKSLESVWESFKYSVLPSMPPSDQAILPTIKTVYPTGEKPLKVLTFKCPTELVGVSPPTTKLLHEAVNLAFDGINKTNLLPFNMQQVCQ